MTNGDAGATPEEPRDLGTELRGAVVRLYRRLRAEKSDDQLSENLSVALGYLVKRGPLTLRELSDLERVAPPSMNQTVNALAALGYVERTPDPTDGRKVLISATDTGAEVGLATRRRRHEWLGGHLDQLTDAERATLLEAARIIRTIADS